MRLFDSELHVPFTYDVPGSTTGALLVHGFPGTPYEWRAIGRALADHGVAVHTVLMPGFGPNIAQLGDAKASDWLASAGAAWRAVSERYETSHLLGFSMGGAVATVLSAELPPDQLVLLSPFTRLPGWPARLLPVLRFVKSSVSIYSREDLDKPEIRELYSFIDPEMDLNDPATLDELAERSSVPTAALNELARVGKLAVDAAPRVSAPTLILQGTQDDTVSPADTRALAKRFGGTVEYLEFDVDHQIVRESRAAYPAVLNAILHRLTPASGEKVAD